MKSEARQELAIFRLIETEISGKVAVKPEQIEDFYKKNPDQFKEPERVRASHILISVPENADAAARAQAKTKVGSSRVDLQACKLEYSIVSPK